MASGSRSLRRGERRFASVGPDAGAPWRVGVGPALCALAYAFGAAHGPWPIVTTVALACIAYRAGTATRWSIACFAASGAILVALASGWIPGFAVDRVWGSSLDPAKTLAAVCAATMFPSVWRWNSRCTLIALATLLAVPALGVAIGYLHLAPARWPFIGLFAMTNLFTAMVEEWFVRGWIQRPLQGFVGAAPALLISAALFGLAHFAGGAQLMVLATLAGLGYGGVYLASSSIWAAVVLHLALNLIRTGLFSG